MIVLDASLMVEWLMGDRQRAALPNLQDILPDSEILVPAHWPIEISNFLRTRLASGQITIRDLHLVLERLDLLQIGVDAPIALDEVGPLAIFSAKHGLTSYDGAYLQLAFYHAAVLATSDAAMRKAAQRLGLPLLPA